MKESIGNAFVFGLVITFSFLIMLILSYAINYSRANKVKNKILNYITSYAELNTNSTDGNPEAIDINDPNFLENIERELSEIGYRGNKGWKNECSDKGGIKATNMDSAYHYCVYAFESNRGYYYGVTTFMYFDIPIIGTTLEFPVYGETKVIYQLGNTGGNPEHAA